MVRLYLGYRARFHTLSESQQAQAVVVYLETKSKGWKETNFQVLNAYFTAINELCTKTEPFPDRVVHSLVPVFADKLGDIKVIPSMLSFLKSEHVSFI